MPEPSGVSTPFQGAPIERLARGSGDVQQGLPILLDDLITGLRSAGGYADLGLSGVLVHHGVETEHRTLRVLDVEEELFRLFDYRDQLPPSPPAP
jgi:hypothetical protein